MLFNISASGSALVPCCFVDWYCMYVSTVTTVGLMWCLLHVMHLPLVVNCTVYNFLWWLWLPMPTTVPWVHDPPSSCWTTTADPMGIHQILLQYHCYSFVVFFMILAWLSSSQSSMRGLQLMTGMMLQTGLFNINAAGLSKLWPNGVIWI